MTRYDELKIELSATSRTWLVTGVAGFIGSHLLETLLRFGQRVVGLDNFATGHRRNLDEVRGLVSEEQWRDFRFIEGDIRDKLTCQQAMRFTPVDETFSTTISGEDVGEYSNTPIDYVLHQAALGSVPRSIEDPATTHDVNVNGFVNMLIAARGKLGFGASSMRPPARSTATSPISPSRRRPHRPTALPYALTKRINEEYADIFARTYGMESIGLLYFYVFGPRQDPNGPYAAVVPLWFNALANNEVAYINGDGETSRDFCYKESTLAATTNR